MSYTTDELTAQVEKMKEARDNYDNKKSISNEAHAQMKTIEGELLRMIKVSGLKKYHAPGFGTVSLVDKLKVKMPKEFEEKKLLLDYLQAKGEDVLLSYFNVNYNSLNSLYNTEFAEACENGQDFNFPGVAAPESETELRFRKG